MDVNKKLKEQIRNTILIVVSSIVTEVKSK